MRASEQQFRALSEAIPQIVWMTRADGWCIYFNQQWVDYTGMTLEASYGHGWNLPFHPDDQQRAWEAWQQAVRTDGIYALECRLRRADGAYRWWLIRGSTLHDTDGHVSNWFGTCTDIHDLKGYEEKLQLAASVFTHAREGIVITDVKGDIVDVNDAFTFITGYPRAEVLGQNPRLLKSGRHEAAFYAAMWQALTGKGQWYGELWNRRKNGEEFCEMVTISAIRNDQGVNQNYVALFTDITFLKQHQQQLEQMAHFDALTLLPNRLLLTDRLDQAIAQADRRGTALAVAYLDLDGFKAVNDMHGHAMGDALLVAVTQRMHAVLREVDTLARVGGDEFVALLVDLPHPDDCEPLLQRLLLAAAEPVTLDQAQLQITASIGVTVYPEGTGDCHAGQLLRHADQALYLAKQAGKNRCLRFGVNQEALLQTERENLADLRRALDRREFVLHYQPKVNLRTGAVLGAEALLRWQHPERGLLPPAEFLPLVEQHAYGIELGEWVLDAAFAQLSAWQQQGFDLPVSVNIAAPQFQAEGFALRLRERFAAYPVVRPALLELEVLESSALQDLNHATQIMRACGELGVQFALDDFGTGYSSLTYLKRLPKATLKIDRSFVINMLTNPDDLSIIEGVIGLAKAFQRQVIAEGLESPGHCARLLELGCDLVQGDAIAHPMPASALPEWAATWKKLFA